VVAKRASMLRYTYIACLVFFVVVGLSATFLFEPQGGAETLTPTSIKNKPHTLKISGV
jgi:hypothetical protein